MTGIHELQNRVRHHNAGEAEADARKIRTSWVSDRTSMTCRWRNSVAAGRCEPISVGFAENPDILMLDETDQPSGPGEH